VLDIIMPSKQRDTRDGTLSFQLPEHVWRVFRPF